MEERDPLLSQAYQAAEHPEPPGALDAAILAAARAEAAPPVRRRPAWLNWALPLSGTAVLVLALSTLLRIQDEAPETLREALPPIPAAPAESVEEAPADSLDKAPASPAETRLERAPQALAPATRSAAESVAESANASANASAVAPIGQSSVSPSAPAARPSGVAQDSLPAPISGAPEAFPARPSEVAGAARAEVAPSPSPATADATRQVERPANSPRASQLAAPAAAPAAGLSMAKQTATGPGETPEKMLETLRRLLRESRLDEFRKVLTELRARYPEYPLPEDLRAAAQVHGGK